MLVGHATEHLAGQRQIRLSFGDAYIVVRWSLLAGQVRAGQVRARGFTVPDGIQERVPPCQDTGQLEAWADLEAAAESLEDIFGS